MEYTEIEKLVEQRDEFSSQIARHNPANADLKIRIEEINQKIRAIVAQQDKKTGDGNGNKTKC